MKRQSALFLSILLALVPSLRAAAESGPNAFDSTLSFPYSEGLDKASLVPAGLAALMPASIALVCGEGQALPAALAYTEAFALTYGAKELLKLAMPRSRPYVYDGETYDGELLAEAQESFPSGHTALAFCAATSLATLLLELKPEAPATPWLVAGGYALAAGTGALRVLSGAHFASDVAAGAALGSGIGWLVTWANIRLGPLGKSGAEASSSASGRSALGQAGARLIASPSALIVNIKL